MRGVLTALGLFAAAAVAAGCGGGAAPAGDPASVAEAAEATRLARTARVAWKVTTQGFGLRRQVTVRGTGAASLTAPVMRLRLDLAPALRRRGKADVVVRGEDVYVRPRVRGFALPGGADWAALDVRRALRTTGARADAVGGALALDPVAKIDALRRTPGMEQVGAARVGGAATRHYRGRDRDAGALEVWVDERDRVRRLRQTAALPSQPGLPRGEVGLTMELSDFGAEVAAPPPAARDTYDATGTVADVLAASQ